MNTHSKYRPKQLADVVWPTDKVEREIMRYANGHNSRPLILHGPPGVGKTLIANLLPKAIDGEAVQIKRIHAEELNSNAAVRKIFSRGNQFDTLFAPVGQRQTYTLIDEMIGNPRAKSALRTCLDEMEGRDLTIMTTNEVEKLDDAMLSRAEVVLVPPVPPERFLKRAQEILVSENVLLDDDTLRGMLESTYKKYGDNRQYYKKLDEIILSTQQQQVI